MNIMETTYDCFASGSNFCLGVTSSACPLTGPVCSKISAERRLLDDFIESKGESAGLRKELFGYVRKYLGNHEDAEDVMNDIHFTVWKNQYKFDSKRKFQPWLYTVATHACIDYQRKNKRHRKMSRLDRMITGNPDAEGEDLNYSHGVFSMNPLDKIKLDEEKEKINESVNRLPNLQRQAVILVYFQGLKYRETAEILKIPVGTVKSRLHKAIQSLKESELIKRLNPAA
jgi:RNA polymerase sigma-70 factor, ECF subfamily